MTIKVNATLNTDEVKNRLNGNIEAAQKALDSTVLSDSNYFVPIKTGMLQKSAINNTRIGSGEVVWSTPYARRLYYEYQKPNGQANPNACARWFEAARARFLDKWIKIVNEYIKH